MREFAGRLIAHELKLNAAPPSDVPPAFLVCDRLRPHLATLMGNAGYRALLARALALAGAESSWWRVVRVGPDGVLEMPVPGTAPAVADQPADDVVLLAQLLGLMVAFIGEELTRRLMREVWPKLPRTDLNFGKGIKK